MFSRLGKYALDPDNKREYLARAADWHDKAEKWLNHHEKQLEKAVESGIIKSRKISNVYTGLRSEIPLTDEEKEIIRDYLSKYGFDMDRVWFSDHQKTVYNEKYDSLVIGTDIKPREEPQQGTMNANQRISLKGALAHELVGHRLAHLKGWTQPIDLYEEVQASIRAARFGLDLSLTERITLLRDARSRLGHGQRLKDIRHLLHIKEE